jgi:hypothetical protein
MAAGDLTFYTKFKEATLDGDANTDLSSMPVNFEDDTLKIIVLTDTHVPDTDDVTTQEHLDDISANEVTTGTGYTGPITLSTKTVTRSGTTVTMDAVDVTIPQDAGTGFSNARWFILYKDSGTPATSPLIASGDLGTNRNNTAGDLTFEWAGTGIFTLA